MSNAPDIMGAAPSTHADVDPSWIRPTAVRSEPALLCERYDWTSMAFGIMLAGAVYPVTLVLIAVGFGTIALIPRFVAGTLAAPEIGELLSGVAMLLLYGVVCGAFIGFVWAGVACLFVLPLLYLLARSLRVRIGFELMSAVCGGIIGFVAVSPFVAVVSSGPGAGWDWSRLLWALAFGPGLTTILGQVGGALGGRREVQLNWAVAPVEIAFVRNGRPIQFGIRKLLWTGFWLSLFLTAVRLSGVPFEVVLPVLAGWILYQSATLCIGWFLVARAWSQWRTWRIAGRSM